MTIYPQKSHKKKMEAFFESIPDDGCVLVFNVKHRDARVVATQKYKGLFHIYSLYRIPWKTSYREVRDLYICWK